VQVGAQCPERSRLTRSGGYVSSFGGEVNMLRMEPLYLRMVQAAPMTKVWSISITASLWTHRPTHTAHTYD
jgi:hypothetical protein